MSDLTLIRVTARHFVAGLVVRDDVVVAAAPILRYMVGWSGDRARAYIAKRKFTADIIE